MAPSLLIGIDDWTLIDTEISRVISKVSVGTASANHTYFCKIVSIIESHYTGDCINWISAVAVAESVGMLSVSPRIRVYTF